MRDLLILGGGITGAAAAREAALAGLEVTVVEKGDFASGTSSKSSKLIHGGQRYLESFEFRLVRESCAERAVLSKLAPHLVHPLPFLFPVGQPGAPPRFLLSLGLLVYGLLAAGREPGPRSFRKRGDAALTQEAPRLEPAEWGGAFRYFDAQADDCLLTLAFLRDAARRGTVLRSRTEAVRLLRDAKGAAAGARCRETETGREFDVPARVTLAALGPWSNAVGRLAQQEMPELVRPSRGAHFFLPAGRLPVRAAVVMIDAGGRRCYALPWRGGTLIGTTDADDPSSPDSVAPTDSDRAGLLESVRHYFPSAGITGSDFAGGFAGLRPLLARSRGVPPEDATREERILEPVPGLIVSVGGKLTTSRRTAARLLSRVARILGRDFDRALKRSGRSESTPLPGGDIAVLPAFREEVRRRAFEGLRFSPAQADRVLEREGSHALEALGRMENDRELARPLSESMPYTVSDLVWGVEEAFAGTADDLLSRRTRLSWESPREAENARERAEEVVRKHCSPRAS